MRTCIHDEQGFLTDQAIHPGRIYIDRASLLAHTRFKRRDKTLREVNFLFSASRGHHNAIVNMLLSGKFCSGKQFTIRHP